MVLPSDGVLVALAGFPLSLTGTGAGPVDNPVHKTAAQVWITCG